MRRSPRQTLVAMAAVLGGVWIGMYFLQSKRQADNAHLPGELPDYELVNLSADELYERAAFRRHANAPQTWDNISLRLFAEDGGIYTRFLRCTIDAEEVERVNPDVFRADIPRWRSVDDLPPSWWPGQTPDSGKWSPPTWFQPADGTGIWWVLPDGDRAIGQYLHYAPETKQMHLWEWRHWHSEVPSPRDLAAQPAADRIATALVKTLVVARHPTMDDDWLHATDRNPAELGLPAELLPPHLIAVDGLLRAKRTMRYLIALRGIDRNAAELLLADLDMRSLSADSAAPIATWTFALPEGDDGQPWVPNWFKPGPGPRWGYSVARPASGMVENARWAAYDTTAKTLYIWDWREMDSLRPSSANLIP